MAKSNLEELKERARKEVASLVKRIERDDLPVDLKSLAAAEGVRAVRFRPILGTAGLAKISDGYHIVINTEAPGATNAAEHTCDMESSEWTEFRAPIRFSIAHELAHLVLVRLKGGDPNKDIFSRSEEALDHLSNELASSILMPAGRLVTEIGEKLLSPNHLVSLTGTFRVSPEALARRIASPEVRRRFGNVDGLVAYAREEISDGNASTAVFRFVAGYMWGVPARHLFGIGEKRTGDLFDTSRFPSGHTLAEMRLDPDPTHALRTEKSGIRSLNAIWRKGPPRKILRCELQFCRTSEKPLGLLLAIRVLEGPIEE